jgi:hypothetical protein
MRNIRFFFEEDIELKEDINIWNSLYLKYNEIISYFKK